MTDLTILSFGGGQDSTALLHLYINNENFRKVYAPGDFIVVMADTGNEHVETYVHTEAMKALCSEHGIEFFHITNDLGYHTDAWRDLVSNWEARDGIGSKSYPKTCTDNLKIQPIYKFVEDYVGSRYGYEAGRKKAMKAFARDNGKIHVLIGIAKGEERRVAKTDKQPLWMQQTVESVYPLIDLGLDRAGCQSLIRAYGQDVPVPSHCRFCPFKTDLEVLLMERDDPKGLEKWMTLENNKFAANEHLGEKNFGVFGKKSLGRVLADAKIKYAGWTADEMFEHRMTHGHCVNQAF